MTDILPPVGSSHKGSEAEKRFIAAAISLQADPSKGEVPLDDVLEAVLLHPTARQKGRSFMEALQNVRENAQWGVNPTNKRRERDLGWYGIDVAKADDLHPFVTGSTRVVFVPRDPTAAERKAGVTVVATGRYALKYYAPGASKPAIWKADWLDPATGYPIGLKVDRAAPARAIVE